MTGVSFSVWRGGRYFGLFDVLGALGTRVRSVMRPRKPAVPILRLIGYWQAPPFERVFAEPEDAQRFGPMPSAQRQQELYENYRREVQCWPDPKRFVDPTWSAGERSRVGRHLVRGALLTRYRGLSPCRFCGRHNGSAELTDGAYFWPEGLAHYVLAHGVRLPTVFVEHVAGSPELFPAHLDPEFDPLGQRADPWANGEADSIESLPMGFHEGRPPERGRGRHWTWVERPGAAWNKPAWVETDVEWWLSQTDP